MGAGEYKDRVTVYNWSGNNTYAVATSHWAIIEELSALGTGSLSDPSNDVQTQITIRGGPTISITDLILDKATSEVHAVQGVRYVDLDTIVDCLKSEERNYTLQA